MIRLNWRPNFDEWEEVAISKNKAKEQMNVYSSDHQRVKQVDLDWVI